MPENDFAAVNAALPSDAEMRLYARAYSSSKTPDELFLSWESYLAHSLLFEQSPNRFYDDYGLNGRQLAQGARIAARRMALLLAEAPTQLRAVLGLKVHIYEAMAQIEGEGTSSNTIFMIETAMRTDAERLDIALLPLSGPRGRTQ